jgi:HAD superfamily hydrolase (TIGR01509 family)
MKTVEMSNFDSVLFDVDETLVSTFEIHNLAFMKVLSEYNFVFNFKYELFSGMRTREVFEAINFPIRLTNSAVLRKQEIARTLMSNVQPMNGAINLLEFFVSHKKRIFSVSSGSRQNVLKSLASAQLIHYIEDSIFSEDVTNGKPDPECYLLALERFNLNSNNSIAVEDSTSGCQSAWDAGLRVVGISNTRELKSTIQFPTLVDFQDKMSGVN